MADMPTDQTPEPHRRKPLRLWPGVVLVILQLLGWWVLPLFGPEAGMYGAMAALALGPVIALWWLFFSRAPWLERLAGVGLMIAALALTPLILHESIVTGAMGFLFYFYAIPLVSLVFVLWAIVTRHWSARARWATMVASILLACGAWALVRTGGFDGSGDSDFAWRWSPTPEEQLVAQGFEPTVAAVPAEGMTRGEWPGFRGTERNGVVSGARIATDWSGSPPVELWRREIGPGWSSFAVAGDLLFTQEQRGEDELVTCYRVSTGEPVWRHGDAARFWESNAGAGPRATPTLADGHVYTQGATGILNALDARDGSVLWSRNAVEDTGATVPDWGIAGSPLIVEDTVIVAAAGRLAAYDRVTGELLWQGPDKGWGYSSPHLVTLDGVEQVVLLNGAGAIGVAPADGSVLWEHEWPGDGIVQPGLTENGEVLIGSGSGMGEAVGTRRLAVVQGAGGWTAEERWTSMGIKPYFNDFVVHRGHAYGFDGGILAAISLEDGQRVWKGGRYGHGQLVLLPEQGVLLVLSEKGELALVGATPEGFAELARFPALEGKTWNHPVLVGDVLLVRNGREMAAFRLPAASG